MLPLYLIANMVPVVNRNSTINPFSKMAYLYWKLIRAGFNCRMGTNYLMLHPLAAGNFILWIITKNRKIKLLTEPKTSVFHLYFGYLFYPIGFIGNSVIY